MMRFPERRPAVPILRPLALLTTLVLGLSACSGSTSSESKREAFVEVSSVPSKQPVEIQLNNTKLDVTTPDARNVTYDSFCAPSQTNFSVVTCHIVASVNFKLASGSGSLTLCVTDGGSRQCGTSDQGFVVVGLDFKS